MADEVLGGVVESVTGHLVSLVSQEIRLACGVRAELVKLQTTVSIIGGMLREADKRRVEAEYVKEWLKKLKELFYDADDLLDDFSTEVLRRRRVTGGLNWILNEVRIFFSSSNQLLYPSEMAHRVKEIRERIDAIWNDRSAYFQLEGNSNLMGSLVESRARPETIPFKSDPYVIGRDKDKETVIEFLLNPDFEENVSVLPIVGVGGLGKTTLARLVFNDDKVKEYFEMRLIWVCVSIHFHVEDIVRKIVRECSPNKEGISNLDMNELQKRLGEWLHGKKFLLVLDDVWNENRSKWLELREFLMSGVKGSKILVTTRYPRVVETMTRKFHKLSGLPNNESLSLLMQMAMKEEHEWKGQNLEKIAGEIVKKCAGVPLAIKTIGRLLVFSGSTEEDWLNFKDNDLSSIDQEESDIMPTLKLSYDFLPLHLKPCFAYCSLFPQDYELEPRELVYLWMAQGFINKPLGSKKTLEEVGYDYFRELLSRSFFQDIEEDVYGDIMRCRMHDLMHELARLVAGKNYIAIDSSHEERFQEEARHVTTNDPNVLNGFATDRRIRSMFLIVEKRIHIARLDVSCFRSLRALRIRRAGIKVISRSIGKLKHLRSLDLLGNNELRCLPNSISRLCNLESLILTVCRDLEGLPSGITKLVNLRQLSVEGCDKLTHMPRGIGKLTSLQRLDVFVVGEESNQNAAGLNELSRLTGLRKELTIEGLERVGSSSISSEVDASFSMEKLADLQCLELCWSTQDRDTSNDEEVLEKLRPHSDVKGLRLYGYGGVRLPSWVSQLHRIVEIEIKQCQGCRQLPPIDQMKEEHEWKGQNLEKIAGEIVKKCAGVPLAIKTIGRLLVFSGSTEEDWLNFKDNDLSSIDQEESDIMPTLKLSYDFLPLHLKPCFAYCSLFPQDYELEPRELVYLWMAQGFINKPLGSKKTLEEVGYDYFRELLSRSFFQDIEEDVYGDIMRCRMHDLMHELARLVAGKNYIAIDSSHEERFQEEARHVTTNDPNVLNGFATDRRIRSMFLIVEKRIHIARLDVSCFRSLRALRIRRAGIKVISRSIGKLKHLRSLDLLGNNELRCLPNSISRLCNLESLILTVCRDLEGLPSGITKLVNLRQLSVEGCDKLTHMPRGIGKLTSLQRLDVFVVGEESNQNAAGLNELSRLTGLRKELTIEGLERVGSSSISSEVDASFSMEKLADLQCLELCWSTQDRDTSNDEEVLEKLRPHSDVKGLRLYGYGGVRLPSWVSQLHRIVEIEIKQCQGCRQLPPIDQLPSLKRICLYDLRNLEHIELSESGTMPQSNFFPSLEEITLWGLPKFKGWEWERRGNRIEEEDGDSSSSSSSLLILPCFSDKVKVNIDYCPRFSYMQHGQQLFLHQHDPVFLPLGPQRSMAVLVPTDPYPSPSPSTISDSLSLTALTSLSISEIEDAEHLPVELFQSLPSLQSLIISNCPRLKALPLGAILRYVSTLETLKISDCPELDLSTENDDDNDDGGNAEGMTDLLQLQGHHKLRHLTIQGVHKTECLPGWFQYLSNLQILTIRDCKGLKSLLPGRLILSLLTTLQNLTYQ
ncbi:hypothetical protein CDL15_Pgr009113 [Punica granatum]|uniref:Disease resistance protein RGA3 n=1 Tax=Punica granatum TaxID=22663 RepID=A0A218VYC1_PUNGR|nr:hypothetical protein CDL15_Pgr009113 [Punica granatum]